MTEGDIPPQGIGSRSTSGSGPRLWAGSSLGLSPAGFTARRPDPACESFPDDVDGEGLPDLRPPPCPMPASAPPHPPIVAKDRSWTVRPRPAGAARSLSLDERSRSMPRPVFFVLSALFCAITLAGGVAVAGPVAFAVRATSESAVDRPGSARVSTRPPRYRSGTSTPTRSAIAPVIDQDKIEDGGFGMANQYTGSIQDPRSLGELREAIEARGRVGLAVLRAECDKIRVGPQTERAQWRMRDGSCINEVCSRCTRAVSPRPQPRYERALEVGRSVVPSRVRRRADGAAGDRRAAAGRGRELHRLRRPVELHLPDRRRGRPHATGRLARGDRAVHRLPRASRPATCASAGCLNIAYMTLGEYPDKVPPEYLIPLDRFRSKVDVGRFENVAPLVGLSVAGAEPGRRQHLRRLHRRRPARPLHHLARRRPRRLAVRQPGRRHVRGPVGRGRPRRPGLRPERHPRRLRQRRRPRRPAPARRLGEAAAALAAAEQGRRHVRGRDGRRRPGRADRHRVGRLGRLRQRRAASTSSSAASTSRPAAKPSTPAPTRATAAGSTTTRATARSSTSPPRPASPTSAAPRGRPGATTTATAGSTSSSRTWARPCRLYHNEGDGTFRDVAARARRDRRRRQLRLLVLGLRQRRPARPLRQRLPGRVWPRSSAIAMGVPIERPSRPRLYRNLGSDGFRDVTREVGLDRRHGADGLRTSATSTTTAILDIYLGTGGMSYCGPGPQPDVQERRGQAIRGRDHLLGHRPPPEGARRLVRRLGRRRRPRPLRRGSAAPSPATRSYNLLFQNPGHGRHWLKVKLVGTKTNRAALGARIQVDRQAGRRQDALDLPHGRQQLQLRRQQPGRDRSACATRPRVAELTVSWPTSQTTQTFRDLAADQTIEITEGSDAFKVLPPHSRPTVRTTGT